MGLFNKENHTFPSMIASSSLRIFSRSSSRWRIVSGSYKEDPARSRIVFSLARLCSESGVVEAKYERKEESLRDDA